MWQLRHGWLIRKSGIRLKLVTLKGTIQLVCYISAFWIIPGWYRTSRLVLFFAETIWSFYSVTHFGDWHISVICPIAESQLAITVYISKQCDRFDSIFFGLLKKIQSMTEEKTSFMCYIRTTLHVMFGMVLCKRNVSDLAVHPLNGSDITRNYIFLQTMPDVFWHPCARTWCVQTIRGARVSRSHGLTNIRKTSLICRFALASWASESFMNVLLNTRKIFADNQVRLHKDYQRTMTYLTPCLL